MKQADDVKVYLRGGLVRIYTAHNRKPTARAKQKDWEILVGLCRGEGNGDHPSHQPKNFLPFPNGYAFAALTPLRLLLRPYKSTIYDRAEYTLSG